MTQQALNSIALYRGANPDTIAKALQMQKKSVVNELMTEFDAVDIYDLAARLSIGLH